jgi:hypothetical protein
LDAGFDCHASENGGHAGANAALDFIVGLVAADRLEEQVVLALVVVAGRAPIIPEGIVRPRVPTAEKARLGLAFAQRRAPFGAVQHVAEEIVTAGLMTSLIVLVSVP